jgi:nicotinamidase-related amidase
MKNALLVIDVQKIYTDPDLELYCKNAKETVNMINSLIKNNNNSEIIYIRHIHRENGSDLGRMYDYYEESVDEFSFVENSKEVEFDNNLKILKSSKHIIKTRYSSFQGTDLDTYLKGKNIDKVTVCGFMTGFCCESTAREAHDRGYFVDFITDATGTPQIGNYNQDEIRKMTSNVLDEGVMTTKRYQLNNQ